MMLLPQGIVARRPLLAVLILLWVIPASSLAQTSPSNLADMSLSDLLSVRITKNLTSPGYPRWSFGYNYTRVLFEGYLEGSKKISNASLMGPPNGVTYPILQQRITQKAHILDFSYTLNQSTSLNFLTPYIIQSTDHESIVPGFSRFIITSEGVGDPSFTVSRSLGEDVDSGWTVSGGVSMPVGSITEKGHTPAGPGSQLPYTMQLGSGTWDFPMSVSYRSVTRNWGWGAQALVKIRTGQNDRGYRLGNQLLVSAWANTQLLEWLGASIKIAGHSWGHIEGNDENFPGPIYPTPVADPRAFGGNKVNLLIGLQMTPPKGWRYSSALHDQTLSLEYGLPISQSLHGPQPGEDYRFNLSWTLFR